MANVRRTNKNIETQALSTDEACVNEIKPLEDSDEIEVVAIVPNVYYEDKKSGDRYVWEKAGNIELLSFDTLKNMWRNHRGYFRNGFLKPLDERVIKHFKLENMYKEYDFITNKDSYTDKNFAEIEKIISKASNGMKYTICDFVKNMILNGEVQNIGIIKKLEKILDVDLISFFDE